VTIRTGIDPTRDASFTLGDRLYRACWNLVAALLFRPSPRPLHAWRAFLLRLFGAEIGPHVHVYPGVRIWSPRNLRIEGHVGVGDGAILYNMGPLTIGRRATISQGAHLCGGSHDVDDPTFQLIAGPITIGAHAWICADAFVAMNVSVAEGAVVGARSVVTRSLAEPWTVYAGHPARALRARRGAAGTDAVACASPS
jgi:putative colanic acid biosynthesis acetyltransferase WcaF